MLNNNSIFLFFIYLMMFNLGLNGNSVDFISYSNLLEIERQTSSKITT